MKVNSETLYELINDGTIHENTKLKVYRDDIYIISIEYDGYDFNWDAGTFTSGMFYDPLVEFEIIEEEKEIEELNYRLDYDTYDKCKYDIDKVMTLIRPILENKEKINELVREVRKLKNK